MAIQTCFAKELTWSQDCNHRFLALLGNDSELDLALLDVKNRVSNLALRENGLILPVLGYRFSLTRLGEKYFGIKRGLALSSSQRYPFFDKSSLFPDEDSAK